MLLPRIYFSRGEPLLSFRRKQGKTGDPRRRLEDQPGLTAGSHRVKEVESVVPERLERGDPDPEEANGVERVAHDLGEGPREDHGGVDRGGSDGGKEVKGVPDHEVPAEDLRQRRPERGASGGGRLSVGRARGNTGENCTRDREQRE